jgi:exodeoxyribonuclease V alpha subunit
MLTTPAVIRGTVSKVLHTTYRGGAIFTLKLSGEERVLRVLAGYSVVPFAPCLGEYWEVSGSFVVGVYGRQFDAVEAVLLRPEGEAIVALLAENDAFAGLGWRLARRLWRRLGPSLHAALDLTDVGILARQSVPAMLAISICSAWHKYCLRASLHKFLSVYGISAAHLPRILVFWGSQAKAKLQEDPYRLVPLIGWTECDRVAQRSFGVSLDAPRRLVAACDAVLSENLRRLSTTMFSSICTAKLCEKLGSRPMAEAALESAIREDRLVEIWDGNHSYVIARGVHRIERVIQRFLASALLSGPTSDTAARELATGGISLAIAQGRQFSRSVVLLPRGSSTHAFVSHPLVAGPGIVHVSLRSMQYVIGADVAKHAAQTVQLVTVLTSRGQPFQLQSATLVFVHDSESLDTLCLSKLLSKLPSSAHTCFVGDDALLPPLGIGTPFRDICRIPWIPKTRVHCTETEKVGSIFAAARSILAGRLPSSSNERGSGQQVEFVDVGNTLDAIEKAIRLFRVSVGNGDIAIFTATQRVANTLNLRLHEEAVDLRVAMGLSTPFLYLKNNLRVTEGEKIVTLSTDYSSGLLCGDRGVLTEILATPVTRKTEFGCIESVVAIAEFESIGRLEITRTHLQDLALGYAVPLVRSLPSSYHNVIILGESCRVVDRHWYYSAVVQGRHQVSVLGNREQVAAVIAGAVKSRVRTSSILSEATVASVRRAALGRTDE